MGSRTNTGNKHRALRQQAELYGRSQKLVNTGQSRRIVCKAFLQKKLCSCLNQTWILPADSGRGSQISDTDFTGT